MNEFFSFCKKVCKKRKMILQALSGRKCRAIPAHLNKKKEIETCDKLLAIKFQAYDDVNCIRQENSEHLKCKIFSNLDVRSTARHSKMLRFEACGHSPAIANSGVCGGVRVRSHASPDKA